MTLKQDTRASVLARRKAIPDAERKEKSLLICERFLAEIDLWLASCEHSEASAKQLRIAAYEPMSSEVDVHPLLFAAYERGWEVFLPCMAKDTSDASARMVFFPIEQNHLTLAFPGLSFADPRRFQLQLLSSILGAHVLPPVPAGAGAEGALLLHLLLRHLP